MSSIYSRGGYYVYQRYVKNPKTGYNDKRIYVSLGKNIKPEDIPHLKKQYDEKYARDSVRESISPTLSLSHCKDIYIEQKEKEVEQFRRSINTLRTDRNCLNLFYQFINNHYGDIDVKKISRKHIFRWKETRFTEVESPTTVAVNMRTVRSFFSYLLKTERISENPFDNVEIPKRLRRKEENIPELFSALYEYSRGEVSKPRQKPKKKEKKRPNNKKTDFEWFDDNTWFIHYTWIILNTGMRSGEVSILKWKRGNQDVGDDHSRSYAYISDDGSHFVIYFKRRRREVTIKPPVLESIRILREIKKDNAIYLFENPFSRDPYTTSTFGKLFKKLLTHLKLDTDHSPHSLRHGYGSYLLNNGATVYQVSRILGHSTKEITEMYYTHSKHTDVSDAMDILYQTQQKKL